MTKISIKDLVSYKFTTAWLETMINIYEERRSKYERLNKIVTGMPSAKNKPNYKIEALIDSCDKILDRLLAEQEKLNEVVLTMIDLPGDIKLILTDLYVAGKNLGQTAEHVGYAYENASRKKKTGLRLFDEIIKSRQKKSRHIKK